MQEPRIGKAKRYGFKNGILGVDEIHPENSENEVEYNVRYTCEYRISKCGQRVRQRCVYRKNKHKQRNVKSADRSVINSDSGVPSDYKADPKATRKIQESSDNSRNQNVDADNIPK